MRLIDADKLYPDEMTKEGTLAISQDQLANAPTVYTFEPDPRWISIKEKLPEDGSWNIFTDGKHISIERYKADAIDHFFPPARFFELEDAVAWMPGPGIYKEEKCVKVLSLDEFYTKIEEIDKNDYVTDYLVSLRLKFGENDEWDYLQELYLVSNRSPNFHEWMNDWWEGQKFVEILGFVNLDEIEVPRYRE